MYLKLKSYLFEQNTNPEIGYVLICQIHLLGKEDPEEVYLKCLGLPEELSALGAIIEMKFKSSIVKSEMKECYQLTTDKPQAVAGDKFMQFFELVKKYLK